MNAYTSFSDEEVARWVQLEAVRRDRFRRAAEGAALGFVLVLVSLFWPLVGTTALFFFGLWLGLGGMFPVLRPFLQ